MGKNNYDNKESITQKIKTKIYKITTQILSHYDVPKNQIKIFLFTCFYRVLCAKVNVHKIF